VKKRKEARGPELKADERGMSGKGYFTFTLDSGVRYMVVGGGWSRAGVRALWECGNMLGV